MEKTVIKKVSDVIGKILLLRNHLNQIFPERSEQIDGIFLALLSGEHAVFLGPPGGAKSAMIRVATRSFGLRVYETLLTRFTKPPEIFGPLSLKGIENDEVRYMTANMLPSADVAILDEIFKAGSALLNNLLAIINERLFYNGTLGPQKVSLRSVFGSSNELPQGEGLDALWDRFLFRFDVRYLQDKESFKRMISSEEPSCDIEIDAETLQEASSSSMLIPVSNQALDALYEVRESLATENVIISDRRWKKSLKAAQVNAFLHGESQVEPVDMMVLQHCLWQEPKQKPKVTKVLFQILDTDMASVQELLIAAQEQHKSYQNSPQGMRESASYGKVCRGITEKAHKLLTKASPRNVESMRPVVSQIENIWKQVVRTAAEAVNAPL